MTMHTTNRPGAGISFVLVGMFAITFNDTLVKYLSGDYPLHQLVFTRSAIGILCGVGLVQLEGGWKLLRTSRPGLHILRAFLIVIANMTFFAALAVLPLAEATALFFVAPLLITLLSIPMLGEKVGPRRLTAVAIGFAGVLVMQRPWASGGELAVGRIVLILPVLAAFSYALVQVMTRMLGTTTRASVLALHLQGMFILISLLFYIFAGDGRYADPNGAPSLYFLLRAWTWPTEDDWLPMLVLGLNSSVIGYCLAQAYRLADAATVAPFEYVGLPLAVMWGWLFWAELPDFPVWIGTVLIAGSGLFVFVREHRRKNFSQGLDPKN